MIRRPSDERAGATLGIVTGRRRQGKTFLLRAPAEAAGGFYFAADEATDGESLHQMGTTSGGGRRRGSSASGPVA